MNTAAARENWAGQIVDGKFPLLKWLGGGERSAVFSTQLPGKDKRVAAIKLVSPEAGDGGRQLSSWQTAATLSHPNLLRVFHAGQCQVSNTPVVYVVMEFAEEDLSQILPARPLSAGEVREMLPPLLDALSYLHHKGLVHSRVRPSNIHAVEEQLKLSSDSIHTANESGNEKHPPSAFDAPELARGEMSRAADVWSLGVTLARCLSPGRQARESYHPIEQGVAQTIPEPFRHIVRECLRRNPKDRCKLDDIKAWLKPAAAPSAPTIREDNGRGRPSLSVIATIAAIILLAAAFVVRWATHAKTEAPVQNAPQETSTVAPAPAAPTPQASARPQNSSPRPSPPPASATPTSATASATPPAYSTPGAVLERVVPDVPLSARNTIEGTIRVSARVEVSPAGEVTNAVLTTPGPSKYFARLALEASQRWKFKPAEANGQPVGSAWMLRFHFTQSAADVVPEELPGGNQ